jgi:hypothetical protein
MEHPLHSPHAPHPLRPLERDLDALRGAWADALPAFGVLPGGAQVELEQMSDVGLVGVADLVARARRNADALLARVGNEIARRSGPEFGDTGLAKKQGFHNAARLLAATTGGSRSEAARLIAVGAATAERQSFAGEYRPAQHPHVARALEAGTMSADAAAAVTSMLDRVGARADPGLADVTERALVDLAVVAPLDLVMRGVREAEARLDSVGVEPREDALRGERSLTMFESGGMLHLRARLDPETGAPIKAAIEALVSDVLHRREGATGILTEMAGVNAYADVDRDAAARATEGHADGDAVEAATGDGSRCARPIVNDDRTIPQLQADALAALARHTLGCTQTSTPLVKTTVIVRMNLATLIEGIGHATIDGIEQPVSASTARRLAADAEIIPAVLGGERVPLDLGRASRLFSKAQRLALGERDGGCASCGQNIGYVEAHHIRWWQRDAGPTDLANGVLLCSFCHHRVHRENWGIRATRDSVWFIPPPHIDPARTPRLGGRARFDLADSRAA